MQASYDSIDNFITGCVRKVADEAIREYGLDDSKSIFLEGYIKAGLPLCFDGFRVFTELGFTVTAGQLTVYSKITENAVVVDIKYPVVLERQDQKYNFEEKSYVVRRTTSVDFVQNSLYTTTLTSQNGNMVIKIPSGTSATLNGEQVSQLGIKLIDKHFDGLVNSVVAGNIVYDALPDGIKFSQPVDISIDVRAKDYALYVSQNSLSIGWWDENYRLWKSLDTTVKDGIATAKIDHFTKFTIVIYCDGDSTQEIIDLPNLFKQKYSYITQYTDGDNTYYTFDAEDTVCDKDEIWKIDEEAIVPTEKEFRKIVRGEYPMLGPTVQELPGELYQFGIDMFQCDESAVVNTYCCCNDDGCLDGPMSEQECWSNGDEYYTIDDPGAYNDEQIQLYIQQKGFLNYDILTDTEKEELKPCSDSYQPDERKIFGYDTRECISGITRPGSDPEPGILTIEFSGDGSGCIDENDPGYIRPTFNGVPDSSGKCSIFNTPETFPTETDGIQASSIRIEKVEDHAAIVIEYATSEFDDKSYCSRCSGQVILNGEMGAGIVAQGYLMCNTEDTNLIVDGECKKCEDKNGLYVASGFAERTDCTCTRQNEGLVFCDSMTACHENKLTDWRDLNYAPGFSADLLQMNCDLCRQESGLYFCAVHGLFAENEAE